MPFHAGKFEHTCGDFVSVMESQLKLKTENMKPVKTANRTTKNSTEPNSVVKQPQPAVSSKTEDVLFKRETVLTARTSTAPNGAKENRPVTSPAPVTTIKAKIDVGFGNNLFVRGQGAGLSWERGVPLTCVDGQTWQWSGKADDRLTFKLLLNDSVWAKGEDIVAKPGQKVEVVPAF